MTRALTVTLVLLALAAALGTPPAAARETKEETYEKRLAKLGDDDASGHYRLGLWCRRRKLPARATRQFEKTIAIDPDHKGARKQLGYLRYDDQWVKPEEKARLEFEKKRATVADDDADGLNALAEWCKRSDLYEEAEALYRRVLELDPEHKGAKRALGLLGDKVLEKHVSRYVLGDVEARAKAIAAIRRRDRIDAKDIGAWVFLVRSLLAKLPKHDGSEVTKLQHPEYPIRYRLIRKRKTKDASLLVILHSGGPSSSVNDRTWNALARHRDAPFDLIAMPRVWNDTTGAGWVRESGPVAVDAMIREIVRTYPVDPNRVYLQGYSMGGYGACYIGSLAPDRFAALGVCAAGFSAGGARVANLMHVPVAIHIGENDHASDHVGSARRFKTLLDEAKQAMGGAYEYVYEEYAGTGHQLPPSAQTDTFRWMSDFVRDPAPEHVVWEPFTSERYPTHKHYQYWLHLPQTRSGMRIDARIEGNRITVETRKVREFTIFLNEDLVDLEKSVTVKVNGRQAFRGRPKPSLSAIVETYASREDEKMICSYRIDVKP